MPLLDDGYAALTDLTAALDSDEAIGCHVFLYSRPSRDRRVTWHRLSMTGDLADQIVETAAKTLLAIEARAADDEALAEFDFDAMSDGDIGILDIAETPGLGEWLADVPGADWHERFDGDEQVLERSRFYATRLYLPDGRVVLTFRGSRNLNIALRRRNAVAAVFQRDADEMVPVSGTVLNFDQDVDFFAWGNFLFVLSLRTFESVTHIRTVTAQKAAEAIDAIGGRFNIGDTDALKGEIGARPLLARKLAAALKHGLVADIDAAALRDRIAAKELEIVCDIQGAAVSLQIDSTNRRQVQDFVDLMSDVFLRSPVTNREWVVSVKKPPNPRRR